MIKPKTKKEKLYFQYLRFFKIERKKIKGFFTRFRSDDPFIIKQFLRFNSFLIDLKYPKLTDRIEDVSAGLPQLLKEYVNNKNDLLNLIYHIIERFDALGCLTFPFLTEEQEKNISNYLNALSKDLEGIYRILSGIKKEYKKKRKKVVSTYTHYSKEAKEDPKIIIDSDLKDITKSERDLEKAVYFFGRVEDSLINDHEHILFDFKKFLMALNVFYIRDHKTLKRIASRIKKG